MSFSFFSKKVYNEDLCFIRDLTEIGAVIASVTSIPVMRKIILEIIKKNNLESKLDELNDNGHYDVQDCYPSNREKKFDRANQIMLIVKFLPVDSVENSKVLYSIMSCIKRMEFSYDEKIRLIKNNLVTTCVNKDIENYMIGEYISLI